MLSKAVALARKQLAIPSRGFKSATGHNYVVPETMNEVVSFLDEHRPTYTLIYFTAKWNPMIPHLEKDYEATTRKFQNFTHLRIDCDESP